MNLWPLNAFVLENASTSLNIAINPTFQTRSCHVSTKSAGLSDKSSKFFLIQSLSSYTIFSNASLMDYSKYKQRSENARLKRLIPKKQIVIRAYQHQQLQSTYNKTTKLEACFEFREISK
jgi:hypothetical protein